ncbi:MAG: hypothetical protein COB85_09100 [Bacteroidetes bacterium]|nr:MAG: hypothetical protein COB85_09100 [Bacteroidota bacterium]
MSYVKNVPLVNEALYIKIKPYLSVVDVKPFVDKAEEKPMTKAEKKDAPIHVELNSTDKGGLKKLEGISASLSDQVVKLRDQLGGFINKDQLLEVDGFNKSLLESISKNIEIDLLKVKKINLNSCSSFTLAKHPYLTLDNANAIVNHRETKGNYGSVADIKRAGLVSEEVYLKIMPYLTAP